MYHYLHRLLIYVIFILTSLMFLAVFGQVIFRYVLKIPLQGSEEFARYLMVWIACLAASEAYRQKSHVGVTILLDSLSGIIKRWLYRSIQLMVIVLMGVIAYQGFKLSWLVREQISPALNMPMMLPYLAIPFCALLIGIHAISFLIKGPDEQPTSLE